MTEVFLRTIHAGPGPCGEEMGSASRVKDIQELCARLGYVFRSRDLLATAFRHASYVNEHPQWDAEDNERLEFLGDAVLDLAIGDLLMRVYQDAREGELSKLRAMIVGEAGLSKVASSLALGEYLLLGKGEEQTGGREKPSILANTLEALMGALYLDAGFDRTLEIVRRLFSAAIEGVGRKIAEHDFKTLLQEYTQRKYRMTPHYELVEETGPPHDRTFRVLLTLRGETLARGEGRSKKEAEQRAAREAFFSRVGE
jgi:ribonuclease III